MKQDFEVHIDVVADHKYLVEDVNSSEEAEDIARQWLEDGEPGEVSNQEVFSIDSYPIDSQEDN